MISLSIIIPVYNAERTLEKTLRSLLPQLQGQVEVVIVDDGSTDSTPDILAAFASQAGGCCRLARQENAGAAAARNTAIAAAKGDYLAFVDADDRLPENAVKAILQETKDGVDILGWDWQSVTDGKKRSFTQAAYSTPGEALQNLMGGTMKWNLWLFAVKRELVLDNEARFLDGSDMGEDMAFMLKCFASARKVKQIHEELYEYNASNPGSISQQLNEKRRAEVSRNLASAEVFLLDSSYRTLCERFLPHLKLYIKLPLLIGDSVQDYEVWYNWFPEANAYAMANKNLPFRTRLLQGFAARRMWWAVRLYYRLVYKLVYGLVFG